MTDFAAMRLAMINSQLRPNEVDGPRLLTAIDAVAREDFVPAERRSTAYADVIIPLGDGQSMNTPMVTARLLAALQLTATDRLLIVGDATGYAAAIAAHLAGEVVRDNDAAEGPFDALLIDGAVASVSGELAGKLRDSARVAAGLVARGGTRLARGIARGGEVRLIDFGDADIAVLDDYRPAPAFSF